jgi:hypothetical protein
MNLTQAKVQLRKLLGKHVMFRYNPDAPDTEAREASRADAQRLQLVLDSAEAAKAACRAKLLADPQYLRLVAEWKAAEKATAAAYCRSRSYRVTVGLNMGRFFSVKAEGDNWQDVIDQLKEKI